MCLGVAYPESGEQIHTLLPKPYEEACVLLEVKYDPFATQWVYQSPPQKGLRVQGFGLSFWVEGLGFGVWGLGFRVWGLGFGVLGLVFRV